MTLLGSTPPQIRTQLRNGLIAAAVPPAEADEAVDLGIHACELARQALADCIDRGSCLPAKSAAFSIAVGLLQNALAGAVDAMIADARRKGLPGQTLHVSYGGLPPDPTEGV